MKFISGALLLLVASASAQDYGAGYGEAGYGDDYAPKQACRYVDFDDVGCKKAEVKKVAQVYVNDYYNKCQTKTLTEKKTITVKIRRDVCKSTNKPIRVSTTIPVTKQVCDEFPQDNYKDSSYKKTPDCKIIKSEKIVYTTDHITKWTCKPDYKEETIHVPVKFYKEVCTQYPKKRQVTVPVWVKEKLCYVNTQSKKVCGETSVQDYNYNSGKGYYDDEPYERPTYDASGYDEPASKYGETSYEVGYDDKYAAPAPKPEYAAEYAAPTYEEEYAKPVSTYEQEYAKPVYNAAYSEEAGYSDY